MACYDVDPYLCTYDSGGVGSLPGGGDPDYSSIATWEADTDIDITGYGNLILDCYDSQDHDEGGIELSGVSGTSAFSLFRTIRSSPSCATPWSGKAGDGANFVYTGTGSTYMFNIPFAGDSYTVLEKFAVKSTGSNASDRFDIDINNDDNYVTHILAYDGVNGGAGTVHAFRVQNRRRVPVYNCMAYGYDGDGFYLDCDRTGAAASGCICCTAIDNGGYGFNAVGTNVLAFSCYGADNASGDFTETSADWDPDAEYNCSKDATSDLGGAASNYQNSTDLTTSMDADYLYTSAVGYGRNPYDDIPSGVSNFQNFLRDGTAGYHTYKYDITGSNERDQEDTVDVTWDVGASEYSVTGYQMDADAGSYAIAAPVDTNLYFGRQVDADTVAYSITGQDATLGKGRNLVADPSSYSLVGSDVSPLHNKSIAADPDSYAIAGQDVGTYYGRVVDAESGAYVLAGTDVDLYRGYNVIAEPDSYLITGQDTTFRRTYNVVADPDSYAINGTDVGLYRGYNLIADSVAYSITGQDVTFARTYNIVADSVAYVITGSDVEFLRGYNVVADGDAYIITGQDVTLAWSGSSKQIDADAGSYAVSGFDVTLTYSGGGSFELTAESGTYLITGAAAETLYGRIIAAEVGAYLVAGTDAGLFKGSGLTAEPTSIVLTGFDTDLLKTHVLVAESGSHILTGADVNTLFGRSIVAETGAYILTGSDLEFIRSYILIADPGAYSQTGTDVGLTYGAALLYALSALGYLQLPKELKGYLQKQLDVQGELQKEKTIKGKIYK